MGSRFDVKKDVYTPFWGWLNSANVKISVFTVFLCSAMIESHDTSSSKNPLDEREEHSRVWNGELVHISVI